jgi:hypothetical protein
MSHKILTFAIPKDLYDRLTQAANQQDRDPMQQARHILRRTLVDPTDDHRALEPVGQDQRA